MAAPANAYLNRLGFKTSSTLYQMVAKFRKGSKADNGYYDTTASRSADSAVISALLLNIKNWFHLDGIYNIGLTNYANGFVGYVIVGGSNEKYHNMATRGGHKIYGGNGTIYRVLNDAGLNTKGYGNVSPDYAFDNLIKLVVAYVAPFYLSCTYTFQYKDKGGTWRTLSGSDFNNRVVPAKGNLAFQTTGFGYISEGDGPFTMQCKLICTNDEGTVEVSNSINVKATAYMYQMEAFGTSSSSTSVPQTVYSGNGTGATFYMYKAHVDAILAACREFTPPVEYGHAFWTRGQAITMSTAGLSASMPICTSWKNLYQESDDRTKRYTGHGNSIFLLNKDYGIRIDTNGYVDRIFYAYEAPGNNPYIRVMVRFSRTYDETTERYTLMATASAAYMDAAPGNPSYDTQLTLRARWSTYNGGPAAAGGYFNGGGTYQDENTTVFASSSSLPSAVLWAGYAEDSSINGVTVSVTANDSQLRTSVVYS